jgi:hypothetical protein
LGVTQIPNLAYATTIANTFQIALQAAITHHGIMPNNPDLVPTSINFSPQQFIVAIVNIPPTIDAPTFTDLVGELFQVLELKFPVKSFKKNLQFTVSFGRRMKPSRCSIGGFSNLKRILIASQTWKLAISIFIRWKVL